MSIQQQAYELIDQLPEDSVRVVIDVMKRMMPASRRGRAVPKQKTDTVSETPGGELSPKMQAFLRMQELRQETAAYQLQDYDAEREAALREKYGDLMDREIQS